MPNAGTTIKIITRNHIRIAHTGTVNGNSAMLNTGKGDEFFLVGEKLLHSQSFAMPKYAGIKSEIVRIITRILN